VTDRDIPEELVQRLNAEKSLEIVKRREKTEAHLYMTVRLLFEDMFFGHQVQTLSGPDYVTLKFGRKPRIILIFIYFLTLVC
jgi:ubiquitin carboxyl-terminal hydrolase 7